MNRQSAHEIVDKVISEAEQKKLYGSVKFTFHFADGEMRQVTDNEEDKGFVLTWKRTHRGIKSNGR